MKKRKYPRREADFYLPQWMPYREPYTERAPPAIYMLEK